MMSLTTPTHDVICNAKSVSASASCRVIVMSAVAKVVKWLNNESRSACQGNNQIQNHNKPIITDNMSWFW